MSKKAHLCLIFSFIVSITQSLLAAENPHFISIDGDKTPRSFMTDSINLYDDAAVTKNTPYKSNMTIPQIPATQKSNHIGLRLFPSHGDKNATTLTIPKTPSDLIDSESDDIDIWERIRKGFRITNQPSPLVFERIRWYIKRKSYLEALLLRAKPYLHYILGELEKRKMPTELALLPFVESGFNPFATSHAKATGLWQFIPSTGHSYQLKQDWWVDQRRDIVASTEAALDYLNTLHAKFSSWRLALIAYNWGDGKLQRAIQHNLKHHKPTDPEHLTMPRETRYYIPTLEALKYIVNNPEKYNISLPSISNHPYLFATEVDIYLDVVTAARLAELPLKEFLSFNPSFQRPLMMSKNSQSASVILLPVNKSDIFRRNLLVYKKSGTHSPNWTIEHYQKLTRVAQITHQFHISAKQLLLSNGKSLNTKWVKGDLLIPINSEAWAEWTKQASALHLHASSYTRPHHHHYVRHRKHKKTLHPHHHFRKHVAHVSQKLSD